MISVNEQGFVKLYDMTTHGGVVVTASSGVKVDGKPAARVGDRVVCPKCKGTHVIQPVLPVCLLGVWPWLATATR